MNEDDEHAALAHQAELEARLADLERRGRKAEADLEAFLHEEGIRHGVPKYRPANIEWDQ